MYTIQLHTYYMVYANILYLITVSNCIIIVNFRVMLRIHVSLKCCVFSQLMFEEDDQHVRPKSL